MGADPAWLEVWKQKGMVDVATEAVATELSTTSPSKYRNRKVTVDGFTFDSRKEANRWLDLCAELKAKRISKLSRQIGFPIVVNGRAICEYVADFVFIRDGLKVVEDVKSAHTRKLPVYRIKKKLFEAIYGFEVTEV